MRNILKGFLEPKAEAYVLPDARDIRFEGENFDLDEETEEELPREPLDITVEGGTEEEQPEPEPPPEPKKETPVHYAQLQAELILNQARQRAEAEQEEIRAGARDEGYREGYAQGIAKAMDDSVRDREATAARLEKEVQSFLEKASLAREEAAGVGAYLHLRLRRPAAGPDIPRPHPHSGGPVPAH